MAPRVTEIPATLTLNSVSKVSFKKRKTAGYARVSTMQEEQAGSYETQLKYYKNYIQSREDWEFVGMYADEGISGTSTKKRKGFNKMIQDALDGKIDLIITKSVSRFARNTVDSLTTVRKLKEKGVEVYFEKENIWTLDSKGELLITIMSSLAQEESRSISENTAWGIRKRMADGKANISYSNFLGYDRGSNGEFVINEEQAITVKKIYRWFLIGYSSSEIMKKLEEEHIKTPFGKSKWHNSTVLSILQNEKYKGDALMQKSFSSDFLTKKKVKNTGQLKQYYIKDHHEPIIDRATFDLVQSIMAKQKEKGARGGYGPFASTIVCGDCGGFYGRKVFHSNDEKLRKYVYFCNRKYDGDHKCVTPTIEQTDIEYFFIKAMNQIITNKDEIVENLKLVADCIGDTSELDEKMAELTDAMNKYVDEISGEINAQAKKTLSKADYQSRQENLQKEYLEKKQEYDETIKLIEDKKDRVIRARCFIDDFKKLDSKLTEFDEELWRIFVDELVIKTDGNAIVKFRGGIEIEVEKE